MWEALIPARSLRSGSFFRTRQVSGAMNLCSMGAFAVLSCWQAELSTRGVFHAKNTTTPCPAPGVCSPSSKDSDPCTAHIYAGLQGSQFFLLMRLPFCAAFQHAHSMPLY